jgi:hypothetical protein
MNSSELKATIDELLEQLASIEHERWSHWQRYLHGKGIPQPDGSLLLPSDFVQRWKSQMETAYDQLSESEKQSDREQVRKYLPLIVARFSKPQQ